MISNNSLSGLLRALFVCLSLSTIASGQDQLKSSQLTLTPCQVGGVEGQARCGRYEVFENRESKKGRKISLKIVVLPARGAEHTALEV